jgi:hypothetical protein
MNCGASSSSKFSKSLAPRVALRALDRFFFEFSSPLALAAFRWMFGLTLLLNVVLRMLHTDFYFSDLSGVPSEGALDMLPGYFQPPVEIYPPTVGAAWGFQIAMIVAIVLGTVGAFGRFGSRLVWLVVLFLHLALMQRNYSIVYGADMVTSFWLFGLCFMDSSERLSVREWLASRRKGGASGLLSGVEPAWSRILTSVGLRLVQIQLCVIYMYTGFEKLKGNDWWDQTAVWKVLGNEQLMMADLSFLRNVPLVIGFATWGTVLFEIYAPVLFWQRKTRKWMLIAGWLLHIGIALTMGLYIFSLTMMCAYLLFVDSRWLEARVSPSTTRKSF